MVIFTTAINIGPGLLDIITEIERYFGITLNKELVKKIFIDAEEDQVSAKEYLLFQAKKKFLRRQLTIRGIVDEYEPETLWIEILNIKEKDLKHFNELVSG